MQLASLFLAISQNDKLKNCVVSTICFVVWAANAVIHKPNPNFDLSRAKIFRSMGGNEKKKQ